MNHHPSINEKELEAFLSQSRQLHSIIFISSVIYPLWGLLYSQQSEYHDPVGLKVLSGGALLFLNICSYKSNFINRHLAKIFHFFILMAVVHFHFLLYQNAMIMDYLIAGLIFLFTIVNIILDSKMKLVFAAVFTIFSFVVYSELFGLTSFSLANKAVFYLLGIFTVNIFAIFNYFNYSKIQTAYVSEINENSGLRRWSSVGQMAGGIAHEVNTPLTTMSLILSGLEERLDNKEFDKAKKDVKMLIDIGDKIGAIVHSLRLLTVTGGKFERDKISLFDILFKAKKDFLPKFKEKKIEFVYLYNIESKGLVLGSESALAHIASNLLNNAIDAVENLDEKWVKMLLTEDKTHYKILVQNSGPQIDKSIVDKIFEPFFSTKEIGSGMGIGLSITKTLVIAHSGSIRVDMKQPHVMFEVSLPKLKEEIVKSRFKKAA
jgi:signal transduction histidine kinase